MAWTLLASGLETVILSPSLRLRLAGFDVKMCRPYAWLPRTLPVAVILKRLAAPLWVFNFSFCLGNFYPPEVSGEITALGTVGLGAGPALCLGTAGGVAPRATGAWAFVTTFFGAMMAAKVGPSNLG